MSNQSSGIGFVGILTITFIILKLTEFINWSWWLVLAPVLIGPAVLLTIVLTIILVVLVIVLAIIIPKTVGYLAEKALKKNK